MKNYKINIDKPKPTQDEILSGRNFDAVLSQYKAAPGKVIKKPFWKSTGFIGSVAAVAAAATIAFFVFNGNNIQKTNEENGSAVSLNDNTRNYDSVQTSQWAPTKRTIAPPLSGVNVAFTSFKINAKKGGVLSYASGSKIKFKPGSFVDANGNEVNGNVDIRYREMHDAVDFFLSGIPMQYDSAGQTWQFESAGMLEIAAFVDGKVVYLKKDKPMEVDFASAYQGTQYNLYQFDTVAGNWVNLGKDEVSKMPSVPKIEKQNPVVQSPPPPVPSWEEQVKAPPVEPVKPMKANPSKNRFVVDFKPEEFPEMSSFNNVIFEVDETNEKFDRNNYNITWQTVELSRGDEVSKYKLTLKKGLKTLKLDVYPVLQGKNYEEAIADYEKKHAQFLKDKAAFDQWADKQKNDILFGDGGADVNGQGNVVAQNPIVQVQGGYVYTSGTDSKSVEKAKDVMRSFTLNGFGVFNMDMAAMLPQGSVIDLTLMVGAALLKDFTTIYHVDRAKNSLYTYHNMNPMKGFHFNAASSNLVWAVKNGELFYADNENFASLPATGEGEIALKKTDRPLNTPEEIKAFFNIGTVAMK